MTIDEAFRILQSLPKEWGASEAEVQAVESTLGVRLPRTLRDLMLCTGREAHMHWLFPDEEIAPLAALPFLHEVATEILAEDDPALRPPFPFVAISQHDGYYFSFVRAGEADADPEIVGYSQGRGFQSSGITLGQEIASAVRRTLDRR